MAKAKDGRTRKVQFLVRTTQPEADALREAAAKDRGTVAAFMRKASLAAAQRSVRSLKVKVLR